MVIALMHVRELLEIIRVQNPWFQSCCKIAKQISTGSEIEIKFKDNLKIKNLIWKIIHGIEKSFYMKFQKSIINKKNKNSIDLTCNWKYNDKMNK